MSIETIKLSPKKNGKGYASSYSVSISNKEASDCSLVGNQIIKIIDSSKQEIVIKAKKFTVTLEMLKTIAELKEREKEESNHINQKYFRDRQVRTLQECLNLFMDEHSGKVERSAYKNLEKYLLSLTMENIVDLTLMMYLGRDMDCNMNVEQGEERFLEFFKRYNYLVNGQCKDELVDILLEKGPLLMYLRTGYRLLNAPIGTPVESFFHNWDEM